MSSHSRKNNYHNSGSSESSEDSFINQCESCCYEIQQTTTNPYKCTYNNVLYQYKERLKKAQMELAEKELMIAVLKDQNTKMENYCRCSIEDSRNIKVKYYQLLEEMENFRRDNEIQRNKETNANNDSLEEYLRSEVDLWKEENKEILDKIELMDFDIQKLMHFVSNSTKEASEDEVKIRMARLEEAIEKQSEILASLHSKVGNKNVSDQAAEAKMNNAEYSLGDLEGPITQLEHQAEGRAKDSLRTPFDETQNIPKSPTVRKPSALVLNPEDDVLISIQIQNALKSKSPKMKHGSDPSLKRSHAATTTEEPGLRSIHESSSFLDEVTSTTNTDILEIADKEEKFFDERTLPKWSSQISGLTGVSEISGVSALTPSECEKIFREMPSEDPTKPPQKVWSNLERFNEFEHFESAMFAGRDTTQFRPILPLTTDVEGESGEPAPTKDCCVISNDEINSASTENELQMVLFQEKIPACCRASEQTLKIEEINSLSEKTTSTDPQPPVTVPKFPKPYSSIVEEEIPKMFPTATLDEASSLPSEEEVEPTRSSEAGVIHEVSIQPTKNAFVQSSAQPEGTKPKTGTPRVIKRPECCKNQAENIVLKEKTRTIKEPPKIRETDNIPIIYEFDIGRKTVSEEDIQKRFVAPYSEEHHKHGYEEENSPGKNTLALFDHLQNLVEKLNNIISAAKEESSTLRTLKDDFKIKNDEWNQNIAKIKSNTDKTNENLNELKEDVQVLKTDIKYLMDKQVQQNKKQIDDYHNEEEQNKTDPNKVLERVKNLEKRLCKCDNEIEKERKRKICHSPTGCRCKYKKINGFGRSDEEANTKDKKISFTVQSCILNTSSVIGAPYIVRFGNNLPSLTYNNNKKSNEEENTKGKCIEESPDI
ncbi:TATA element modulatory factor-like isoform X1 [Harmonia axyridis]|uniref:TATA element modulatory factor-like isoform X1 n=1 Tax=Harmonia axyridis TaxID=115357 RepID=UPI001E275FDA|nr:TATA element modulatory factor-like isoform X1 [Harmonia axyridis]